ncbi:hypothetical protein GQR58_028550 [Nymphon striatum]|nr:hypothetical protein GQR58_028550 [Nymphon striatum]
MEQSQIFPPPLIRQRNWCWKEICEGDPELLEQAARADIAEALSSVLPIEDIEEFGIGLDEMYGEVCQNTVQALPGISAAWKHCMGVTFSWELEPTTQKKMPLINWKLWICIQFYCRSSTSQIRITPQGLRTETGTRIYPRASTIALLNP